MKTYYLHNGTDQEGPFTEDELKQKNIQPATPIWSEGMTEWSTAADLSELKEICAKVPPPFLKTVKQDPVTAVAEGRSLPTRTRTKSRKWIWRLALVVIIVTGAAFVITKQKEQNEKESFRIYPELYIDFHHNGFTYNKLFGGISDLKFTNN